MPPRGSLGICEMAPVEDFWGGGGVCGKGLFGFAARLSVPNSRDSSPHLTIFVTCMIFHFPIAYCLLINNILNRMHP
jgi:hypothetical protein